MRAPHDEVDDQISEWTQWKTDLPPCPAKLYTPASILSRNVSPSNITQARLSADLSAAIFNMRSPFLPILFGGSAPGQPSPNLHSKLQAEQQRRGKTNTTIGGIRNFSASKALDQVLGMKNPEPFVPPPAMPRDLAEKFEVGLQEYEQLQAAGVFAVRPDNAFMAHASKQHGKTILRDILEEGESPVRASPAFEDATDASNKFTTSVPIYTAGKKAIATAHRYNMAVDSYVEGDITSQLTGFGTDEYDSWRYGSSTTLAVSDYSRPGSAENGQSLPLPPFPPRRSSLVSLPNLDTSKPSAPRLPHSVTKKLFRSHVWPSQPTPPASRPHTNEETCGHLLDPRSSLKKPESLPALFHSPGVLPAPKVPTHNQIARRYANEYIDASSALNDDSQQRDQELLSSLPPRIKVQAISPAKATETRKRTPPSTHQRDFGPTIAQNPLHDNTTGLPVLTLEEEELRTKVFWGNTYALLTILLTWSHTMWDLYHRLPDPKLFAIHPAFTYPVTPPISKRLVSVSFYSTSASQHKEVRFLGPGDAAEMSYHEVDVFADRNSNDTSTTRHPTSPRCNNHVDAIKKYLGLAENNTSRHSRFASMPHRAKTGEGRWCYVLVKGHKPVYGSIPPHVMLAWHVSAVTSTSDCLHTLYTDDTAPVQTRRAGRNKFKRLSSLQNLAQALRGPAKFGFRNSLKTASSSSELPPVDPCKIAGQREGVTLNRTIMKFEKAGDIPLAGGFRVDVEAFREWMETCGRGEGKVILWSEKQA